MPLFEVAEAQEHVSGSSLPCARLRSPPFLSQQTMTWLLPMGLLKFLLASQETSSSFIALFPLPQANPAPAISIFPGQERRRGPEAGPSECYCVPLFPEEWAR